ncbi:obscurin-like [Homarus americanus]|uniref:obscurin-like n=2 Tax=Homarus americanus TaxID=6706 RepID=UPI001C43774D|nr:obscurin-like [Homarus americanus]
MSHKYVSNKAVMKNQGFLDKLGSTLMSRSNPNPMTEVKTQSSITWHKTSDVKARIKTATGTIAIYEDMSPEEIAELQEQATMAAGGTAPELSGAAATAVQTAAIAAGIGQEEEETTTTITYLVNADYHPDDPEGLAVVAGQKLVLVDKSSPHKRPRLEGDDKTTVGLLDNSAAKHKMAVRPKRNHPDPRSRAQEASEERWLVRDQESGKEGLVPSRLLAVHTQETTTSIKASLKRSMQHIAMEETLSVKKNLMKEIREFKTRKLSSKLLGPSPEDEARAKRTATIRELIETEEEFVRDLEFVMENYYCLMDKSTTPRSVRDQKELIFNNFKFIADFHQNVLIEGVKFHSEVPTMIGRTFLRLERDFDKHAEYCSNEPLAQEFLENNVPIKEFFEDYSQKLGDDKRLQEHLKLPIQRLNDYQLLLRELVKFSTKLGDDTADLQRAYELMQSLPQRATDAKFISSIEGFKGNLFKLGRLIRHDWFSVREAGQKARDRYLFLFKARILITKVRRIGEDRSVFILKDIIRLPETSLGSLDQPKALEFFHIESLSHPNYPILIEARTPEIRDSWLAGIKEYVVDTASVEDLLFDDELRVVSQDIDEEDAGIVSPVPEVQEYEDLPEDEELFEKLAKESQEFLEREPSPPAKRQKPESQPLKEVVEELDFWAVKEEDDIPVQSGRPSEGASPTSAKETVKGVTLEQVEESRAAAEQKQAPTTSSPTPQQILLADQQEPASKPAPEPTKPATEAKPEPPKPAEAKPAPPKPTEAKPEPPKPADAKPSPPKPTEAIPAPSKPELPKLVVPTPEVSKPEVKKEATKPPQPTTKKMDEPTTPFTPGGSPKPVFTKTLKGDVVEPGDSVSFVCEVAHPLPYFVTWLKDSKPLDDKLADRVQQQDSGTRHTLKMTDEGARHTLQVMNCRVQDSGIYTAKATDEVGASATCSAQLLVQELTEEERARRIAEKSPFFLVRMKPTEVIENTNLSYTIHVKGDPMPEIQFFKDDTEIKEDSRVTLHRDFASGHYELLISHVQKSDEATYKCLARNKFGRAECQAMMTVSDEELVYESLSGKGSLLAKGEKAEFTWFRDGQEYDPLERFNVMFKDDEDTLALVFQNVTPEDAGLYTCVASTSCGKISCSAELTVEGSVNRLLRDPEPPIIKEELTDTQVAQGGSAMLECKIGGFPKPELEWTKNGLDVKVGGRFKLLWEDEESVALVIKNVEERDAGLYRVMAKNELGEVECSANLAIKAGPKIKNMKKEVACVIGQPLNYKVEVEGEPKPEIRWMKDGKPLVESDRIKFGKDADNVWSLKIDAMQMGDCGCYTVMAVNPIGQVSEFFNLESDAAPQITRGLDPETEKKLNYDIAFEVRATGSPKPDARWFHNGKEIMGDDKFKMIKDEAFYILKIRKLDRKDKGKYTCELTNTSGKVSTEGELIVRAPPDFIIPVKDVCAKEGSKDVKLFVEWEANPKPSVKWFFNDKPIREETPGYTIKGQDTTQVLTIHEAAQEFVGTYTVKASNEYGESVCKARFRLHEAPAITEGLKDVEFLEDNTCKYTFKATGIPLPEIKWTKDGKKWSPDDRRVKLKVENEDTFSLVFEEAKTEDSGHYVATVSNVEGSTTTEGTITVNTDPRGQSKSGKETARLRSQYSVEDEVESDEENKDAIGEHAGDVTINSVVNGPDDEVDQQLEAGFGEGKGKRKLSIDSDQESKETAKNKKGNKPHRENSEILVAEEHGHKAKRPHTWTTTTAEHSSHTFEKDTNVGDDMETTFTKATNVTVSEELSKRDDGGDDDNDDDEGLVFQKTWDVPAVEEEGTPGYRMLASCSVHRQENVTKTIITAESDVGDQDDVSKSSIVHLLHTVEVEEYKGVLSDEDEDVRKDVAPLIIQEEVKTEENRSDVRSILIRSSDDDDDDGGGGGGKGYDLINDGTGKRKKHTKKSVSFDDGLGEDGVPGDNMDTKNSLSGQEGKSEKEKDDHLTSSPSRSDNEAKADAESSNLATPNTEGLVNAGELSISQEVSKGRKKPQEKLSRSPMVASLDNEGGAPPHIVKSNFKDGKSFIAMHKFVLEVEATAVPEAVATWYCNGKELKEEEDSVKFSFDGKKYTVERIGSDPEHSGEYKCVLKNKIKEVEEVGQVTVKEKEARVRNKLEDVFVKEHTDAVIKCQIVGDPIPEVQWLRDGKPLPTSEKFEVTCERMSGWHTLIVKEVKETEKCSFTVKGKNQHGECQTTCRMGVLVKPQPGPLADETVDYGKDLHLTVPIHAFPPPTMVWTLMGKELHDGEHFEYTRNEEKEIYGLRIHSAVLEDAGKITFTASNAAGSEAGSCTVKVHTEKPAVIGALENLNYCLEDDVTFTLRASGLPLPECQWKKNGVPVKADDRHVFTNPEPGVYCLTIKDLNMDDYGDVSVAAKSLVGECSSKASLVQKKLPCEVVEGLDNVTKGAEGDDVTLTVKIRASPRPNFVWTKDGDVCEASGKIKIDIKKTSYCEATISLTLVEASSIDSGQYRLKFSNELNETSTETALVVRPVRMKPKVTRKPKDQEIMDGKSCKFEVKIIGFPKPEVKWLKDGHQVYPTDVIDTGVTAEGLYYLEFKVVSQEDAGRYTVHASNEEGAVEADTSLVVTPPPSRPEFIQSLRASKVILGYPVRMEVKLGGSPRPEVQWLKDGQPINIDGKHFKQIVEPDGTVILQIDSATEGDMGEITCVAKNPEGDSKSSATLSVLGFKREDGQPDSAARFSEGLKDMSFDEGQTIRLPVAMKGGPVPHMKWYKDGQEIKLGDRAFYTYDGDRKQAYLEIRPAVGTDSGKYKCVIQNAHGSAETDCEVTIRKSFSTLLRADYLIKS